MRVDLQAVNPGGATTPHDSVPGGAVSHAILTHQRARTAGLADGDVLTPSHHPTLDEETA